MRPLVHIPENAALIYSTWLFEVRVNLFLPVPFQYSYIIVGCQL